MSNGEEMSAFSDDELKAELARRDKIRTEELWAMRKAKAKYLCADCGMPDGWHSMACPSDTD